MGSHSELSPSSSSRWLNCTASVYEVRRYKNNNSSSAQEGTKAHELAEVLLSNSNADLSGYDDGMVEYIEGYVNYVEDYSKGSSAVLVEQKVSMDEWVPDAFGTVDAIVLDEGMCHIIDLKYGKGVPVFAENNTQLMLYALGAYETYGYIHSIDTFENIYARRLYNLHALCF